MMGFTFPDNFQNPYLSRTMTEFWRRWHMTLGGWFREYVYIPLGGNRRFLYRNLFVVWMLTGLWHGANWNFVLWGLSLFGLPSVLAAVRSDGPFTVCDLFGTLISFCSGNGGGRIPRRFCKIRKCLFLAYGSGASVLYGPSKKAV